MLQKEVSSAGLSNGDGAVSNGIEISVFEPPGVERHEPPSPSARDPYRGVVIVLLVAALTGMVGGFEEGLKLGNPVLIDAAVTLGLAAGILIGVAWTQAARLRPPPSESEAPSPAPVELEVPPVIEGIRAKAIARLRNLRGPLRRWYQKAQQIGLMRIGTAIAGIIGIWYAARLDLYVIPPPPWTLIAQPSAWWRRASPRPRRITSAASSPPGSRKARRFAAVRALSRGSCCCARFRSGLSGRDL